MTERPLAVVTSFSADGWRKYAARFVDTFNTFWPPEVGLHLVSEDPFEVDMICQRPITLWPLHDSALARAFLTTYEKEFWAHGDPAAPIPAQVNAKWRMRKGYCFRHDAYKFCKKVFSIALVAPHLPEHRLFWLDADVVTFAPVSADLYPQVLPSTATVSYLPRPATYSELGFVGFNLPEALPFIQQWVDLYASGRVFDLEEWHDCWAFDILRKQMPAVAAYPIRHSSNHHPFINSPLGQYMDHLKGIRKIRGRSLPVEQQKHTSIPYWMKHRR